MEIEAGALFRRTAMLLAIEGAWRWARPESFNLCANVRFGLELESCKHSACFAKLPEAKLPEQPDFALQGGYVRCGEQEAYIQQELHKGQLVGHVSDRQLQEGHEAGSN